MRASAILTGAGISVRHPAGLPLGDAFHDALLRNCFDAARHVTDDRVSPDGLALLMTGGRRNILGCIEDCLDDGTVTAVLDCMRVRLPTQEHLLCAMLAARGVLQLTLNFDNGIELAYALLTGTTDLPGDAPTVYRDALTTWRAAMPAAPPLQVVATPQQLGRRQFAQRPLLIKLRGSVDIGTDATVVPLRPAMEDLESTRLDDDRLYALREAVAGGHLLITGHSGRDLDLFESLLPLLRPDGFTWVTPELDPAVAARLHAVDPHQSHPGNAEQALRAQLPPLPPWPTVPATGHRFDDRFAAWWRTVPVPAAAEGYAWMLSEAGRHADAIAVLRALAATTNRARIRVRLADAIAQRADPADTDEAAALFRRAAAAPGTPAALRAYAMTRWTECRTAGPPSPARLLVSLACGAMAVTVAYAGTGRHRVATRCLTGIGYLGVRHIDAHLALALPSTGRRTATLLGAHITRLALRYAWRRATHAGTQTRQTDLELFRVHNDLQVAILGQATPPTDTHRRLDAIERAYTHRGNHTGMLWARLTRALAHLADGDAHQFADATHALRDPADRKRGSWITAHLAQLQALADALIPAADPDDPPRALSAPAPMGHALMATFATDHQSTGRG
jgi:hypothetical protein